jgi:chemotaxis family two-component system response regulator Rcp1
LPFPGFLLNVARRARESGLGNFTLPHGILNESYGCCTNNSVLQPVSIEEKQTSRRLAILLVENDAAMAKLTHIAFQEVGLHEGVIAVADGDEALEYLRDRNHQQEDGPDLIFLDLHLPKKSGLEVLKEIKESPVWSVTPVVVVSGYADPMEIRRAYELHASCYVRKPSDLGQFLRFAQVCYEFWGQVATLPTRA